MSKLQIFSFKAHSFQLIHNLLELKDLLCVTLGLASSLLLLPAPTSPRNARIRRGDPLAKTPKPNVKRGERRTVAQKRKFRRVHGLLGGLNCLPGNIPSWLYISCKASWGKEKRKQAHNVCTKQPKISQLQDRICGTNSPSVHSIQFHLLSLIWAFLLTIQVTFKPLEGNFGTIKTWNLIILSTTTDLHPAC